MTRARRAATATPWPPVRRWLRATRRARSRRTLLAVAGTVYEVVLTVAVLGGLVSGASRRLLDGLVTPPEVASVPLALATGAALVAAVLLAARAIGPLVADPARSAWLLPSPVDRARLLAPAALAALGMCAAAGLGAAVLVAAAAGVLPGAGGLLAGALVGLLAGELALAAQVRPATSRRLGTAARALLVVALAAAAVVALVGPGTAPGAAAGPRPVPPGPVLSAVAVLAALSLVAAVPAARAPGRAGVRELAAGAPLVAALGAGPTETGLVGDVVRERRLRRRGPVRPVRLPRGRRTAPVAAGALAVARNPAAGGRVAAGAVVPHVLAVLVPVALVPAVQLAGVTAAAFAAAPALATVARSPALRRALGGTDRQLLAVHAVPPAGVAVLVAALVAPAGGTLLSAVLLPVGALAVVLRHLARPQPVLTATLLDTPFGTLPVEQVRDRLRGGPVAFLVAMVVVTVVGA